MGHRGLSSIIRERLQYFDSIKAHFKAAIEFINEVKNKNGKILVHCKAGVSRSATMCLAYLISNRKMCLNDAYDEIKVSTTFISEFILKF